MVITLLTTFENRTVTRDRQRVVVMGVCVSHIIAKESGDSVLGILCNRNDLAEAVPSLSFTKSLNTIVGHNQGNLTIQIIWQ